MIIASSPITGPHTRNSITQPSEYRRVTASIRPKHGRQTTDKVFVCIGYTTDDPNSPDSLWMTQVFGGGFSIPLPKAVKENVKGKQAAIEAIKKAIAENADGRAEILSQLVLEEGC